MQNIYIYIWHGYGDVGRMRIYEGTVKGKPKDYFFLSAKYKYLYV